MCRSVFTFRCYHLSVAEAIQGDCHCGKLEGRKTLTSLCPSCTLFSRAVVNTPQLHWLLEQQENAAETILTGFCLDPFENRAANGTGAKFSKSGPLPPLQSPSLDTSFRPATYAAAVRGKPGLQKPSHQKVAATEDQKPGPSNYRQQHGGRHAGKKG
ncbi:hypothetical protein TWF730_003678 [Orbilia blumenaviensis]|uniref:Uncharacterized protein n=1 Tax=Orbilia blumenaviensis TaxID=1796055 RepID=A0AAV9U4C0_9PEZI